MKELQELGYLHLEARRGDNGKMQGYHWYWFHEPISEEEFKKSFRNGDFPALGKPGTRKPRHSGNPCAIRRTSSKNTNIKEEKEKRRKEKEAGEASPPRTPPSPSSDVSSCSEKKKPVKQEKRSYGEDGAVKLSDEEYEKLAEAHGTKVVASIIEQLNDYIMSTGKRYKSHYHVLRTWLRKETTRSSSGYPKKSRSNPANDEETKRIMDNLW
jgi:hypothetical protein